MALSSCNGAENRDVPAFDSLRALGHIESQVSLGPRVPGTEAHDRCLAWMTERLRECTPHVAVQTFRDTFDGHEEEMTNVMASFLPEKTNRILLCAHWDSRPRADRDPDSTRWNLPVPGANDGASGVAVLIETARALKGKNPPTGVDIVFFDGEDGGAYGNNGTWLLGSRHFARVMPEGYRPEWALLLDMIGDRDLALTRDFNSMRAAPALWSRVAGECKRLGIPFQPGETGVLDDHIPLIDRGIPAVDLIDFEYPSWHTISDTPDKCSAESLGKIGALVFALVYGE